MALICAFAFMYETIILMTKVMEHYRPLLMEPEALGEQERYTAQFYLYRKTVTFI